MWKNIELRRHEIGKETGDVNPRGTDDDQLHDFGPVILTVRLNFFHL